MPHTDSRGTVVIANPNSGSGRHVDAIRREAESRGYALELSGEAGEAVDLARAAARGGASTIVAAGGDGTVNEVVRGIDRADALDEVTLGVVPVGTGNNFAKNLGIPDVDTAFAVLEGGERRRIDLGRAGGRPFLNSCVAGLTADSSSETSAEMKNRLGVLAYVIATLRSVREFDAPRLDVDIGGKGTDLWTGEAICVLIGNGRRFTTAGGAQANMEDGLLDVTIVEDVSALDLMSDTVGEQLLGGDSEYVVHSRVSALDIAIRNPESVRFSLDGEIVRRRRFHVGVDPAGLTVVVGETYDPDPDRPRSV